MVTYPCFSNLQIKQMVSCIEGVLIYRKRCIYVDEKEVDKFAARVIEVKKIMARHKSLEELSRSQTNTNSSSGEMMLNTTTSSSGSVCSNRGTPWVPGGGKNLKLLPVGAKPPTP